MKRMLGILLIIVMIVACLPLSASAFDANNISVDSKKVNYDANKDQTVTIEIKFTDNSNGIMGLMGNVVVDSPLSIAKIVRPEVDVDDAEGIQGAVIDWVFVPNMDEEGDVIPEADGSYVISAKELKFVVTVTVPKGTPVGKYNVGLNDIWVCDGATNEVELEKVSGSIEVVEVSTGDHTHKYGDADMNGRITVKDASLTARKAARKSITGDFCEVCADVDGNGRVTAKDASMIARRAARKQVEFPAESK